MNEIFISPGSNNNSKHKYISKSLNVHIKHNILKPLWILAIFFFQRRMLPLQFCTLAPKAITTSNARTLCNRTNQKVQNHQKLMMWWLLLGDCFVQHFNPWTCNKSFVLILLTTVVLMKDFTLESTLIQVCSVGKWNLEIRFTEIRILGSVVFFFIDHLKTFI